MLRLPYAYEPAQEIASGNVRSWTASRHGLAGRSFPGSVEKRIESRHEGRS